MTRLGIKNMWTEGPHHTNITVSLYVGARPFTHDGWRYETTIRPGQEWHHTGSSLVTDDIEVRLQLWSVDDVTKVYTEIDATNPRWTYPSVSIDGNLKQFKENEWWHTSSRPSQHETVDYFVRRNIDSPSCKEFFIEATPRF